MSLHAAAVRTLAGWTAPDDEQEELRQSYLSFLASHADGIWRECAPAHMTASALVVDGERERVLLLLHGKVDLWLQPGGHCEPGDVSLAATALREATEETGIDGLRLAGTPVRLDRHDAPCRPGVVDHHLDVQYLAIAPPDARPRLSDESRDMAWYSYRDLPPATDVHPLLAAALGVVAS